MPINSLWYLKKRFLTIVEDHLEQAMIFKNTISNIIRHLTELQSSLGKSTYKSTLIAYNQWVNIFIIDITLEGEILVINCDYLQQRIEREREEMA